MSTAPAAEKAYDVKAPMDDPAVAEKDAGSFSELAHAQKDWHYSHEWTRRLLRWGLETRGA